MVGVGIVGLRRGRKLGWMCRLAGMDVRAVCDLDAGRSERVAAELGAAAVPDVEALLDAPVDAVVLANAFDGHAPLAIQALDAGKHVLSETAACSSPAEAVALLAAVERSGRAYLLAENYLCKPHVRTMVGLVAGGVLGDVEYVEAEYLHALSPAERAGFRGDADSWRRRITPTAYCSHTVAPIMRITGARPAAVAGFLVPKAGSGDGAASTAAALLVVRMDDGTVAKALHGFLQGEPRSGWSRLRVHGSHGYAANDAGGDGGDGDWSVRLETSAWASADHTRSDTLVPPDRAGIPTAVSPADEGDFLVCAQFLRAVRGEAPPLFGAADAVDVSLVGMYAALSIEAGGTSVDIPDLRDPILRAAQADRHHPSLTTTTPPR